MKFLAGMEEEKSQLAETRELSEKITEASQTILKLQSFYNNRIDSTEILEKVFLTLPKGVYLTSVSWQREALLVALSGFSPSRELLFELRNNLQEQRHFGEINFPPQNWIKPTNIDFQATFKVNP